MHNIIQGASFDAPAVEAAGLVKRFGPREVLAGVDLTVARGHVHALLGANGSGKSTFVKLLSGFYARDGGRIMVGGVDVAPDVGVAGIAELGVRTVHQDLGLVNGV